MIWGQRSIRWMVGFCLAAAPSVLTVIWIPYPVPVVWGILFGIMTYIGVFLLLPDRESSVETLYHNGSDGNLKTVAVLTIAALAVRLLGIDRIPPGLWLDEAHHGLDAFRVIRSGHWPVFFPANTGREPLFLWMVTVSVRIFGATVSALRLPAALSGTLLVPVVFLTARRIFGSRVAVAAAALAAFSRWSLTFSRIGFRGILVPLVECAAVYMLYRMRDGGPNRYVAAAAGFFLGVGFYTGIPYRVFPLVFAIMFIGLFDRIDAGRRLKDIFWLVLTSGLVSGPLVYYFIRHPLAFSGRMSDASVFKSGLFPGLVTAAKQFLDCLLMWHYRGDGILRHNLPAWPLADPVTGVLILVGFAEALRRFRFHAPILVWLAGALLPAAFGVTWTGPHALRSLGALPPVMMLGGIGAVSLVSKMQNTILRRRMMFLILSLAAVWNLVVYFGPQRSAALAAEPKADAVRGFNVRETRLVETITELAGAGNEPVFLSPQLFFHATIQFLTHGRCRLRLIDKPYFFTDKSLRGRSVVCVIDTIPRNMFWLRNSPSKRFFDWWAATYHPAPGAFEKAIEQCYIPRTGLNNTSDNLIREALVRTFPSAHVTDTGHFEIWRIHGVGKPGESSVESTEKYPGSNIRSD